MTALVNRIIPFSSVDGPGNRTAVFLQGCNFNCRYCHNPETIHRCIDCGACVSHCVPQALTMVDGKVHYDPSKCVFCDECFRHCPHNSSARVRSMTARDVMDEVAKNIPFIRGLTVSGGECTLWRDFLAELLPLAKQRGLHTLLDSNGSYDFSADPVLMAATDGVMLDVKSWSSDDHLRVTGQDNALVKKNLLWLARNGKLTEVRTVVVPDLFDTKQTVSETARALKNAASDLALIRYKIIRYRPMGVRAAYSSMAQPDDTLLNQLADMARSEGMTNVVIT